MNYVQEKLIIVKEQLLPRLELSVKQFQVGRASILQVEVYSSFLQCIDKVVNCACKTY